MRIHVSSQFGTDLSSRQTGVKLRQQIEYNLEASFLDFSGVRTISSSFADETFAVLFLSRGEAWFKSHIRIAGASESVRIAILAAIDARSEVAA
jgi:hypothetical protein